MHPLLEGLSRYQREHLPHLREHFARLAAEGQRPSTLFIGCADSRLVPNLLTDSGPGEIFVVRNLGAFVPPFEHDGGFHGVSAGIEYATAVLGVTDIVVCGHTDCGAIRALYQEPNPSTPHMNEWLELGRPALEHTPGADVATVEKVCILIQLERLLTFPMVRERVEAGRLKLHGWYFVIQTGEVLVFDAASGEFVRPL